MKIRSFIAIDFPQEIKIQLKEYVQRFKRFKEPIKYVKESNFHLTLKFLGDVEKEQLPEIIDELRQTFAPYSPFSLRLKGNGVFPMWSRARVLWIGMEYDDTLLYLQKDVESRLELLGFEKENREFKPHLTIGRVKGKLSSEFIHFFKENDFYSKEVFVDSIILMKSTLHPAGAIYEPLHEFILDTNK